MKRFIPLFGIVLALCLALLSPANLFAQTPQPAETLKIGDSVNLLGSPRTPDDNQIVDYLLDAQAGQKITLRWENDGAYYQPLVVEADIFNAEGLAVRQVGLLDNPAWSVQVYVLDGTAPYHIKALMPFASAKQLTLSEGDKITRSEQPALSIGATVDGRQNALDALPVHPLNVQAGDTFTMTVEKVYGPTVDEAIIELNLPIVRDANGTRIEPDFIGNIASTYTIKGDAPYRIELPRLDPTTDSERHINYRIQLEAGNTTGTDAGILKQAEPAKGKVAFNLPLYYGVDAQQNQMITLRYEMGSNSVYPKLRDGKHHEVWATIFVDYEIGSQGLGSVAVYKLDGPPPYQLYFLPPVDPSIDGHYNIQLDAGDTLERHEIGTLAPGQRVQGVHPQVNDNVLDYYRLDVDPTATITLNWNQSSDQYVIIGADDERFVGVNANPWEDGFDTFDLSKHKAPFILRIDDDPKRNGQPYTFTLAEGTEPLSIDAATPATAAQTTTVATVPAPSDANPTVTESTSGSSSCSITSSANINQRSGPGTNFALAGSLSGGSSTSADGQAQGTDSFTWYHLINGGWVRSDLVITTGDCENLPIMSA
ncbi:MAG: hypothetical protein H0X30_36375 [Anaerolineae bacterium]|nr:hypothetical protein [Anaerolineae bacterium]